MATPLGDAWAVYAPTPKKYRKELRNFVNARQVTNLPVLDHTAKHRY
jgi:hypothetical protein